MKPILGTKLGTKVFFLFMTLSLSSVLIIGIVNFINAENSLKQRIFEQLESVASGRTNALQLLIDLRVQQIEALAAIYAIRTATEFFNNIDETTTQTNAKSMIPTLETQFSQFQKVTKDETEFFDFKLIDKKGIIRFATDKTIEGQNFSENPHFKRAISGESFLEYYIDKKINKPLVVITAPVLSTENESVQGVLIVTREATIANAITTNREGLGESGEVLLIHPDGVFITKSRFVDNTELNLKPNPLVVENCAQNKKTREIIEDYRGIQVLEVTSCLPQGLIVVAKIDQAEALTSIDNLRNVTIVVSVLSTLAIGTVAFFMSKSIVNPILRLNNLSKQVTAGNFNVKAGEKSDTEIGELGKSFNNMIESIKLNEELRVEAETLRQISKEKEEFAAMISHELKTPLVPIQGYSELLVKERLGELTEMQKNAARTIFDNTVRLSRLIQDILDVRKMELGRLKLDIRDTSTKEIINQCLVAFKTIAQSKGVALVDNSQDIPLQCDPERIMQVINNLLSNSFKFIPQENGKIEVVSKIDNGSVIFSVKDNGIGIPKDKQDSLFKKFYQVDTTLGRKSGGSGLGLVISKGIIESHKGKIWLESEPGQGTVIYFSIPMEVIR